MQDDEDEAAELEEVPEEDFGGNDLPPPPPPPPPSSSTAAAPPAPPPPELVAISKRIATSTDNLEMQALVHAALCASIADVLADHKLTAADRRRELRVISAAAAKSFPLRRLYEAEQTVLTARRELEDRRRARAGAAVERRASAGGGKVIPIRGAAVPDGRKP